MTDETLLERTKELVKRERQTLLEILECLRKNYSRKLYAGLGYSSLVKYMVHELGYSESAAYRRFQALKLTEELPQVKSLIEQGSLNLSNIGQVQTLMKHDSTSEKSRVIEIVKSKTSKECERILAEERPEVFNKWKKRERVQMVGKEEKRLSVTLNERVMDKLDQVKALSKVYDTAELIEKALDLALKHYDPREKGKNKSKGSENPRVIPAATKRYLYERAKGRCEYKGCVERHFLEVEHVLPVAKGGTNAVPRIHVASATPLSS